MHKIQTAPKFRTDGSFQALGDEDYALQMKSPSPPAMAPKFICGNPNPQCDVLGGEVFGR